MNTCLFCQSQLADGASTCNVCGRSVPTEAAVAPYTSPVVQPATTFMPETPMAFHNFYKWYLMVIGGLTALSSLVSLISEKSGTYALPLVVAALSFLAGLFLYQNKRNGFVLQKVRNIIGIVGCSLMAIMSLICIFSGGAIATMLDEIGSIAGGAFMVFGIILLIVAAGGIVVDALVLKYYEKRKHFFQN